MKKTILLLSFLSCVFLFQSCKSKFYQVSTIKSDNVNKIGNYFIYEDSNIKISYDFWGVRGSNKFVVYNKTDKPIYLDWNKSNFIYNGVSNDYYKNITTTSTRTHISAYGYLSASAGSTYKENPMVQLPPQSQTNTINKFNLSIPYLNDNFPKRKNIINVDYEKNNSFLVFRNYIGYSFDQNYVSTKFIDNSFWVSNTKQMKKKVFNETYNTLYNSNSDKFYSTKRHFSAGKTGALIGVPILIGWWWWINKNTIRQIIN